MLIKNHLKSVKLFQGDTFLRATSKVIAQFKPVDLRHIYKTVIKKKWEALNKRVSEWNVGDSLQYVTGKKQKRDLYTIIFKVERYQWKVAA